MDNVGVVKSGLRLCSGHKNGFQSSLEDFGNLLLP